MDKIIKKYILILLLVSIFSILFYYNNEISVNSTIYSLKEKTFTKNATNKTVEKCEAFIKDSNQSYYFIDGKVYPQLVPLFLNKSINFECLNQNKPKVILLWAKPGYYSSNVDKENVLKNVQCPVTNCEISTNKSKINESDFVLVHMNDPIKEPPEYRPQFQRWIFSIYESPYLSYIDYKKWKNFFNMTSTYKIGSDLQYLPNIYWNENKMFNQNFNFYGNKTKFAVALISNCKGTSKRLSYIDDLRKYINVDIYGKCGMPCPTQFKNVKINNCREHLAQQYKFFLAFENNICKDYVTEKFFDTINFNIIPVVLGGADYDQYVKFNKINCCIFLYL